MGLSNPFSVESRVRKAVEAVGREHAPRELTTNFLIKGLVLSVVVAGSVVLLATRFSIAIAVQESLCLPPYRLWVIDKRDTEPVRGEIFAFKSKGLSPVFADGTTIVKVLEGMPGDVVEVTLEQTTINKKTVGRGLDVAVSHGIAPQKYVRNGRIEDGRYWFFGRTSDSFDSRYWGSVGTDQIIGKAYPLW